MKFQKSAHVPAIPGLERDASNSKNRRTNYYLINANKVFTSESNDAGLFTLGCGYNTIDVALEVCDDT